jgi:hypothetical protein
MLISEKQPLVDGTGVLKVGLVLKNKPFIALQHDEITTCQCCALCAFSVLSKDRYTWVCMPCGQAVSPFSVCDGYFQDIMFEQVLDYLSKVLIKNA